MRLIDAATYELREFFSDIPPYAILSHTWEEEEVSFQEFQDIPKASLKLGFDKIRGTCRQALKDNIHWCWVDTCCIDKTSSAELSEAINSMFAWYKNAKICYVYLSDVETREQIASSRWFTRGWTLQELLAPNLVLFYSAAWEKLGTKMDNRGFLFKAIPTITGIENKYLRNPGEILSASIATRMSWASRRKTTRVEDLAYCLLGIFDIHMPLLYGEGLQSFIRLQEEIIKQSNDQTIFCWSSKPSIIPKRWYSILAPSPAAFESSSRFQRMITSNKPYNITNAGLFIKSQVYPIYSSMDTDIVLLLLDAEELPEQAQTLSITIRSSDTWQYCIFLCIDRSKNLYQRLPFPELPFLVPVSSLGERRDLFILCGKHGFAHAMFNYGLIAPQKAQLDHWNFGICIIPLTNHKLWNSSDLSYKTAPGVQETFGVASFTIKTETTNSKLFVICFVVRKIRSRRGNFEYLSNCSLLPIIDPDRDDAEILARQTLNEAMKANSERHYAEFDESSISLGSKIVYSSMNSEVKNLQLCYLALHNKDACGVLQNAALYQRLGI